MMWTGDSSDLAMKGKEKGLREEGKVDDDQVALEERGPHHLDHPPLGSVLAKQELHEALDWGVCGEPGEEEKLERADVQLV
jgi:hypothetical protein